MSSGTVALDPSIGDYADTSPAKLGRNTERLDLTPPRPRATADR